MTALQTPPTIVDVRRSTRPAMAPVRPVEIDLRTPKLFDTVEYINAAMRAQRLPSGV